MSTPAASPNPLQQLSGRLEDVFAEAGIQPRLRFTVNVNNRNNCSLELMSVTARLHAQFVDEGHGGSPGMGAFVVDILLDRNFSPTTISPGDSGS